jgi:hypothetical protein
VTSYKGKCTTFYHLTDTVRFCRTLADILFGF